MSQRILQIGGRGVLMLDAVQHSALQWARTAFATDGKPDEVEPEVRVLRFIEEAVELGQAQGLSEELVLKQVKEVFSRPKGEVFQEIGGSMVTLLCFGESVNMSVGSALDIEISRINSKPLEHFQRRQREKMAKGLRP